MGHKSRCYVGHMEQMDDALTRLLLPLERSTNMKRPEHLNVPNSAHFQIFIFHLGYQWIIRVQLII